MEKGLNNPKLLKNIAFIALGFAFVVSLLIVANYLQVSRIDPVNSELLDALVERLNENPDDQQLQKQIREVDLLARKAYFTSNWQIRTGGYLILIAIAIAVIVWQLKDLNQRKQVLANPDQPKDILGMQRNARWGIAVLGTGMVVLALSLALFSNNKERIKPEALAQQVEAETPQQAKPIEEPKEEVKLQEVLPEAKIESETIETNIEKPKAESLSLEKPESKPEPKTVKAEAPAQMIAEVKQPEPKPAPTSTIPTVEELKRNHIGFRGYYGQGIVYDKNTPTKWDGTTGENIKWKTEIPLPGYNSPIVWEGKVFLSGANENVREVFCFDRLSGKLLWRTKAEGIPGSPAKAPKTTADTGLAAPTMATDGVWVYVIFGTGDVMALDMDGNVKWSKNLGVPINHYGHSSSLMVHQGKLLIQYDQKDNPKVLALNTKDGETAWESPRKVKISWASPMMVEHKNKMQFITVADPYIHALNPETGKELWKVNSVFGEVGPSAAYSDGKVFGVNEYAVLVAIDLNDPSKKLWESDEILSDVPSPIAANGYLIVPASYGVIGCFNANTGELIWDAEVYNNVYSSPMLVNNLVYLIDTKGNTHIFELGDAYNEVSTNPLGEDVYCTPAFAHGQIFIRTNKHLYCIGK